jgi:hypothetical protein
MGYTEGLAIIIHYNSHTNLYRVATIEFHCLQKIPREKICALGLHLTTKGGCL